MESLLTANLLCFLTAMIYSYLESIYYFSVSLNLMTFPAILQEQLEMEPAVFPSLKESTKPVCPCPPYFRMHLINRQTCLYFKVSPPFYLLCIQESLSEASAVTTLITPTQYRAHGWLRAYK